MMNQLAAFNEHYKIYEYGFKAILLILLAVYFFKRKMDRSEEN
jgi:hypothetical protein